MASKDGKVPLEEWVYRRGYNTPVHKFMNPDGTATSRVFKLRPKDEGKLSVDVKSLTTAALSIGAPDKYFLFEVSVKNIASIGLDTWYDPLTLAEHGVENPAHAYISGLDEDDDILPVQLASFSRRVIV